VQEQIKIGDVPKHVLSAIRLMGGDTNDVEENPAGFPKNSLRIGPVVYSHPSADGSPVETPEGYTTTESLLKRGFANEPPKPFGENFFENIFGSQGKPYRPRSAPPRGPSIGSLIFEILEEVFASEDQPEPKAEPEVAAATEKAPATDGLSRAERPGVGVKGGILRPPVMEPIIEPVGFVTTDNGVALRDNGLSVMHIHDKDHPKAGATICYRTPEIDSFQNGNTIVLPVIAGMTIPETLNAYFGALAQR
jgi:hypothetical protein